jgi:hypothetical protein
MRRRPSAGDERRAGASGTASSALGRGIPALDARSPGSELVEQVRRMRRSRASRSDMLNRLATAGEGLAGPGAAAAALVLAER